MRKDFFLAPGELRVEVVGHPAAVIPALLRFSFCWGRGEEGGGGRGGGGAGG